MQYIPETILLKIFSYLQTDELTRVSRVNSVWRRVSLDWRLWQTVNLKRYGNKLGDLQLKKLIKTVFPTKLRCLDLTGFTVSTRTLRTLRENCPRLISLNLDTAVFHESYPDSPRINYFPRNLRKLNVARTIGPLSVYQNISQSLNVDCLESFAGSDVFIESLEASTSHNYMEFFLRQRWSLKILEFDYSGRLTDHALTFVTFCCRNLQSLCVRRCRRVTGTFLRSLFAVAPSLRSLILDGTMITDEVLCSIQWDKCLITELDLSWCRRLSEAGLLACLPKLKFLRYLRIGCCGHGHALTDTVLLKMAVRSWNFLEVLDISFNSGITDKATGEFLLKCKNLRYLLLNHCRNLTPSVFEGLKNIPNRSDLYIIANFEVRYGSVVKNLLAQYVLDNEDRMYRPKASSLRTFSMDREMRLSF